MVPAVVVMGASAFAVALVPNALNRRHGFGLTPIHLLNQCCIHLFAKPHPVRSNLQCFIEKVILAGDNVDKITDASRCVVCTVYGYEFRSLCLQNLQPCEASLSIPAGFQCLRGMSVSGLPTRHYIPGLPLQSGRFPFSESGCSRRS